MAPMVTIHLISIHPICWKTSTKGAVGLWDAIEKKYIFECFQIKCMFPTENTTHLQIIRPHHGQHRRNTKVRQKNDCQRHNDRKRNISLRIDRLFARRGHTIEAHKSVETLCRTSHNARNAKRHEATFAAVQSGRDLFLGDGPIGWVGWDGQNKM